MIKPILKFFDRLEDRIRNGLSKHPLLYAMLGGVAVVLFWYGVEGAAVAIGLSWFWSLVISIVILLATGLFVSFFVGEDIILTGLRHEKKLAEKTETEVMSEKSELDEMKKELDFIKKEISLIKDAVISK